MSVHCRMVGEELHLFALLLSAIGKVFIGAPCRMDWASILIVDRSRCLTMPKTANRRRAMNNDGNVVMVAAFEQCLVNCWRSVQHSV